MGRRSRRVVDGDVFELIVNSGYVPLQIIGKHARFGWAARVIGPIRPEPIRDADSGATGQELYVVLMGDVSYEERLKHVRYVGNAEVPPEYKNKLPIFRANSSYLPGGRHAPDQWWLDDGVKSWRVGTLTVEQRRFPYFQLTPALALRDLVERGWDPEWEFKPGGTEFATSLTRAAPRPPRVPAFFLIFSSRGDAERALPEINDVADVTSTSLDEPDDDGDPRYLVVAEAARECNVERVEAELQTIAARHNGTYDGNEIPLA